MRANLSIELGLEGFLDIEWREVGATGAKWEVMRS